jgi:hypothetical protein
MLRALNDHRNLVLKTIAALLLLAATVLRPELLVGVASYRILGFCVYHILWLVLTAVLIQALIDHVRKFRHSRHSGSGLLSVPADYLRRMDLGAARTVKLMLALNGAIGFLYWAGAISATDIIALVAVYIALAELFNTVWCPFRDYLIGNKCCHTCRIKDWGYLMALAPLGLIPSFWTRSIVAMSGVLCLTWECLYRRHAGLFHDSCNPDVRCANCTDIRYYCKPEGRELRLAVARWLERFSVRPTA